MIELRPLQEHTPGRRLERAMPGVRHKMPARDQRAAQAQARHVAAGTVANVHFRRTAAVPVLRVAPGQLAYYADDGLGFSLKPPKWLKKAATAVKKAVTIKNVLKAGAVVGGILAAPVVLPVLAAGAGAVASAGGAVAGTLFHGITGGAALLGRGVTGAVRGVGSGIASLIPHGGKINPKTGQPDQPEDKGQTITQQIQDAMANSPAASPAPVAPTPVTPAPTQPSAAAMQDASAWAGGQGGDSGGGVAMPSAQAVPPPPGDTGAAPDTAGASGAGGALPLIALGGLALLMLSNKSRGPRRSRSRRR